MDFRVAEYQLRQHGISCYKTPADEKACPNWMKMGFQLYQRLERMGYHPFPARGHDLQYLEAYPHASFCTLLERTPLPKQTLEGRIQRQLVLHQQKMDIPDPMDLLKAITPQRLLEGEWPLDKLYSPGELDALVAAYTAWQAANQPDQVTPMGDDAEGLVILPVAELKRRY
jgi:predicted RNase H-like nuclease